MTLESLFCQSLNCFLKFKLQELLPPTLALWNAKIWQAAGFYAEAEAATEEEAAEAILMCVAALKAQGQLIIWPTLKYQAARLGEASPQGLIHSDRKPPFPLFLLLLWVIVRVQRLISRFKTLKASSHNFCHQQTLGKLKKQWRH